MKTEIIKVKGDWQEVVDDCRATVAKPPLGKEPSEEWKRSILIAEHEPIRDIWIKWKWRGIKYWIAMHWKTHIWPSRVNTQRTDRTGIDRDSKSQDAPIDFTGDANCQHLIDTMRKRLCYMAASETREYAQSLKRELHPIEPELADVLGLLYSRDNAADDDAEIEALIEARAAARAEKNWAEADRIRDELKARNIVLEDTPQGVKWHRG